MGATRLACALVCLLFACGKAPAEDDGADVPRDSAEFMAVLVPLTERDGRLVIDRDAWTAWAKWYDSPQERKRRVASRHDIPVDEVTEAMLREEEPEDNPAPLRIFQCWSDAAAIDCGGGAGWGRSGSVYTASDANDALTSSLRIDTALRTFSFHAAERGGPMRSLDVFEDPHAGLEIAFHDRGARASVLLRAWPDGRVAVAANRGEEDLALEGRRLEDLAKAEPDKLARLIARPLAEIGIRVPRLPRGFPEPRGLGASNEVAAEWTREALHREDGSIATLDGGTDREDSVVFTPDGASLLVGGKQRDEVQVWSTKDWTRTRVLRDVGPSLVLGPDGRSLAAWGFGPVRVVDLETGACLFSAKRCLGPAAFADGGRVVVAATWGGTPPVHRLHAWDIETGEELWTSEPSQAMRCDLAADRSASSLAVAWDLGKEERVSFPDARTGKLIREWKPTPSDIRTMAWSVDGKCLLTSGTFDGAFERDPADGRIVRVLEVSRGTRFSPSPDGKKLALFRGGVRIRDAASGRLLATTALPSGVTGVAWSPDGALLATATRAGVVKVWRAPK